MAKAKLNDVTIYRTKGQHMNLIGWQTPQLTSFGTLSSLRDEIDRLFGEPLTVFARASQQLSDWAPALDVHETKENLVVTVELPGMKKIGRASCRERV